MGNKDGIIEETDRLLPGPGEVRMRLYGQGLGDCFLLAFPRPSQPDNPCYVVIDCGVAKSTPGEKERMIQIVQDIHSATGGTLDVLAVTHQHYDHVIGFVHAKDEWAKFTVKDVWVPWTEIPGDADAQILGKLALSLNQATVHALGQAMADGSDAETLATLQTEAGFLGLDADTAGDATAFGALFGAGASPVSKAMELAKGLRTSKDLIYCEPGHVHTLPDTGARAFVLGPPRLTQKDGTPIVKEGTKTPLVKLLVDEDEMYHYSDFGMTPDSAASGTSHPSSASERVAVDMDSGRDALAQGMMGLEGTVSADEFNRYCPFDASLRLDWDEALLEPFFWEHYTSGPDWRRVDGDWLGNATDLALAAGGITNNISLVLAFELPGTKKVLLFVGDAQVGNWLSWDFIPAWTDTASGAALPEKPDMNDLLGRVAFYKVGHHGSHNATIKAKGLERMAKTKDGKDTDLLAFIPVSVPVAHDIMGYCPMPFYPVLRALQDKTGGRVFLANGSLLQPLPLGTDPEHLRSGVMAAPPPKTLPAMEKDGAVLEAAAPMYIEVTIPH